MAGWTVILDDAAIATDRTALDLNSGPIRVEQAGVSWGDAQMASFMADQKWGSTPVDYRVPNRTITIPLLLGADDSGQEETYRAKLQEKVSLFQREGGWLTRQRDGGPAMYAEIVDAVLSLPDAFGETGGVEPGVVLTLVALPDFFGDEVTLDALSFTGAGSGVLKQGGVQAVIGGDYPARCRIVLTDTSGNAQSGLLWGVRSRHYDAASTAALVYEAEAMTGLNGAASATRSGASGGHTMKLTAIPAQDAGLWVPMMLTDVSSAQLTHRGSYRVWARVYATDAGSRVRLVWGSGSLASPVANDAADVPDTGQFFLLDLGSVRLDATPVAAGSWQGVFQVQDPNGTGTFEFDRVYLQPIDESSGRESALTLPSPTILSPSSMPAITSASYSDDASSGTRAWVLGTFAWQASIPGGGATTHLLKLASLGFSIPSGATVVGIAASITRRAGAQTVKDAVVKLLKAGTLTGNNKATGAAWPGAFKAAGYGGESDLWGAAWVAADINNAGFGVELQATVTGASPSTIQVSSITVTVYYKLSAGFTVSQDVVIAANGQAEIRTEGAFRPDPSSGAWGDVSSVIGDLPRLPPSGLEGRAVELLAKVSRGDLGSDPDTSPDAGLDGFTAQVLYRPAFLHRP